MNNIDFSAVFIVPTGIGASIGGFAGDASPAVNLISKICPVITNPNTVNAAVFSGINKNILYTEGYAIDSFFKGEIALRPSKHNKIGVIFDKAIPENVLNIHINTINAVKTVYGINIQEYTLTDEEVGIGLSLSESGISTGDIENPSTLLRSARYLLDKGIDALAVVCYFPDSDDNDYSKGTGVDIIGGVEAVISHIITREFLVPTAHAPAFEDINIYSKIVDPRASAEYITPTFLPTILLGLYNAPKLVNIEQSNLFDISLSSIKALIMPYNCLGCVPVLKAIENNIPVLAVESNKTVLSVSDKALGLEKNVIKVKNYHEAAGYLLGLREGISF